jgi:hypothetical protein
MKVRGPHELGSVLSPEGCWLQRFSEKVASAEVLVADRDYWSSARIAEPALGAGVSFDQSLYEALSVKREWIDGLDAAGFSFELWADWVRIYGTRPLRDVLSAGDSMADQAALIGEWTREAIDAVSQLDPGEVTLPA